MKKIKMNQAATMEETFKDFLTSRKIKGVAEKTLETYSSHLHAVFKALGHSEGHSRPEQAGLGEHDSKHEGERPFLEHDKQLHPNAEILLFWCNAEGLTAVNLPLYKAEETVKETYTDAELKALLKKPDVRKCTFAEFRDWVIVNFLLNSGCRAATVRAIQIRDLDLDNSLVYYRHTKNKKAQVIPLCSPMTAILREYLRVRGGAAADYLFCTESGGQLTENGLRQSIARYNQRRGVEKTSIHLFRHTFARKYLIDCGGDAFTFSGSWVTPR